MFATRKLLANTRSAGTLPCMNNLVLVDSKPGENRSQAIARRLREELAGRNLSISELARRLGTTQQRLSRRVTGTTDWRVEEVEQICAVAALDCDYVLTGIRALPVSNNSVVMSDS